MTDDKNIKNDQNQDNNSKDNNSEVIRIMTVPTLLEDLGMEMDEGPGKYPVR